MAWSFLLDFNDGQGDRDITALVDLQSIRRKFTLWNDLSPTANTLTFDLNRSPTILTLLLTNEKDTDITVTKDAAAYFKGTVRPNFKVSVGPTVKQTKIECVDLAEKLKRKIDTTFAWESYKVCDTSTPASSILHQLLIKAGFELGDINVSVDIDKTIDFFVNVPVHADQTYWDALTSILFEFGYMWYFDAAGEFNIYDFLPTDTSTSDAFDNDNMLGELAISKKLMSYEGTEVRFTAHKTEAGALVFNDTTGGTSELPCNISLDPAENYPEGSADRYVYSEYQFEGGDIVIVKDAAISVTKETGIDYDDAFVSYFKRALFSFINNAGVAKTITKLQITGDVTYRGDLTKCRCLLVENTEKLFTYDAAWITATADGDKLAIGLARHFKYSDFQYSLHSKEAYGLGAFVDIQDDMLGINNRCVIVGIEDINPVTGEQIFSLEGIEEYSAEDVESEGTFTPAPPPAPGSGPTITEGTAPSYTEIIEGFTEGGGTKTPTAPTLAGRAFFRTVALSWERQLNLTNFDHYDLQVSADGSTWYGLGAGGDDDGDWRDEVDVLTPATGELYFHTNIPPAGNGVTRTLRYRVRRVTKAPLESDWSNVEIVEMTLLGEYDLAQALITAAKIANGAVLEAAIGSAAVVASKLAAGAVVTEKLSVIARSHINNVTQTGVLNAWGGVTEEGAGDAGIMSVEAVTAPDGATAIALRMTNNGNYSIRTKTFAVNHDAIYRCTIVVKKNNAEGRVYFGVSAYAAVTEGAQSTGNGQGNKLMIPYPVATRIAGAESDNIYFARSDLAASPTTWTIWTSYLIGANRSIDDVPQQVGDKVENFIKLKSDTTHAAIRVLDYNNTSPRTLDIYNPTVVEMGTGQVVAENIAAGAVIAGKLAAGAVLTDNLEAAAVTADKIDVTDLDVHKCTVTDATDRYIEISADKGLYAEDEDGNIIHDIPDVPILSSMKYGGHALWRDGPSGAMAYINLDYTDAETSRAVTSATTNSDLSSYIPSGMTNAKGIFCLVIPTMVVPATKVLAGTKIQLIAKFSTVYNAAPAAYNYFHYWVQDNFTAGAAIWLSPSTLAMLPIVYDGATPYITWNLYMNYTGMDSGNANYYLIVSLRILGVFA